MTKKPEDKPSISSLTQLAAIDKLKHEELAEKPLDPQVALLKAWQARRMAATYADLLAMPRYKLACEFFLTDIYAARDFSQRDHDLLEMHAFMQRFVPEVALRPLTKTIELYALTQQLDDGLLKVLTTQLGVTTDLTEDQYAEAYRLCDNYVSRVKQIDMICEIGALLDDIVRRPLTGAALQVAKVPARRAGWQQLIDFMERGFIAFKKVNGAGFFLKTVRTREMLILDNIYALRPRPFDISHPG
jgi:hypothetical protein